MWQSNLLPGRRKEGSPRIYLEKLKLPSIPAWGGGTSEQGDEVTTSSLYKILLFINRKFTSRKYYITIALSNAAKIELFFCPFRATHAVYGSSQARGWIGAAAASLQQSQSNTGFKQCLWPTPQLTATPSGSLIHWARPRMEPESSWILVEFITTEPCQELLNLPFFR